MTWEDAVTVRDEMDSEDLSDASPCVRISIGFLLKMTRSEVIICMEDDRARLDPESDCQTVTGLPRKMIRKIVELAPKTVEPHAD